MAYKFFALILVSKPKSWLFNIITTSSKEVFPARSPIPLIVHSTCLAPFANAEIELAVAKPKSLWQCAEMMALSMFFTLLIR